jgi:hypothetical protein
MDAPRSLDSAKTGHTDIQKHYIRLKLCCPTHALQPVCGLTYDLESRLGSQERTDLLSEHFVVIYNQNS